MSPALIVALLSAAFYGTADFFGGLAARRAPALAATVVAQALGAVMGSFSVAAVLGVPAGLELARWGGWRLPFFSVAGLGLVLVPIAIALLPPLTGHLASVKALAARRTGFFSLLARPTVQLSAVVTIVMMSSAFLVIPIITPYLVFNLRFPAKDLKWIYMIGGALSFVVLRIIGVLVDRYGSTRLSAVGTAVFLIVSWLSFVRYDARVGPHERVPGQPWVPLRRPDHLLRLHAGGRDGQRSPRHLLPPCGAAEPGGERDEVRKS